MKTLLPVILSLALVKPVQAMDWFQTNTPLTQAHQHLLEDDLAGMFNSLVELWQTEPSKDLTPHLNDLLGQSLSKNCGKSLTGVTLPDWISGVNVIRQTIQSPGRDTFRLVIKLRATTDIEDISFRRWVDESISGDSSFSYEEQADGTEIANERSFSSDTTLQVNWKPVCITCPLYLKINKLPNLGDTRRLKLLPICTLDIKRELESRKECTSQSSLPITSIRSRSVRLCGWPV